MPSLPHPAVSAAACGGDPHMFQPDLPHLSLPQSSPSVHLWQSVPGGCEGCLLWPAGLQSLLDGPSNHEPGPITACCAVLPPEGERGPARPVGGPYKEETTPRGSTPASHLVLPRSWHHLSGDVPGCRFIQATPYGGLGQAYPTFPMPSPPK